MIDWEEECRKLQAALDHANLVLAAVDLALEDVNYLGRLENGIIALKQQLSRHSTGRHLPPSCYNQRPEV